MKRKILGLMVVALAVSLSAYTNFPKKGNGYYWFPLNGFTGAPQTVATLTYSPNDPAFCTNWAPGTYCSGAFSSYSGGPGAYSAAGVEVMVDYNLYH
jgi:hypothetical protein